MDETRSVSETRVPFPQFCRLRTGSALMEEALADVVVAWLCDKRSDPGGGVAGAGDHSAVDAEQPGAS